MNRRTFILGSAVTASAALLSARSAPASEATPEAGRISFADVMNLPTLEHLVARVFEPADPSDMPEYLTFLATYACQFPDQDNAQAAAPIFAKGIRDYSEHYNADRFTYSKLRRANIRHLGDKAQAWTIVIDPNDPDDDPWTHGITTVVKGDWLQVFWGETRYGNPVEALADFSEVSIRRWPGTSKETTIDGIHTGGLWNALPELSDMPEGVSISTEWDFAGPL